MKYHSLTHTHGMASYFLKFGGDATRGEDNNNRKQQYRLVRILSFHHFLLFFHFGDSGSRTFRGRDTGFGIPTSTKWCGRRIGIQRGFFPRRHGLRFGMTMVMMMMIVAAAATIRGRVIVMMVVGRVMILRFDFHLCVVMRMIVVMVLVFMGIMIMMMFFLVIMMRRNIGDGNMMFRG